MASNHLILCHPLLLLPSIFPSIRVFSNESVLHIKWPKYWSFNNFFKLLKRKFNREILNLVYALKFSLAKFSCSIVSDSLQCHGPQHARLPCLSIYHQLQEFAQTHVHRVGDATQPSHPLSSSSPPALNLSQHQSLFKYSALNIRWPKYWSFSFNISPSK